MKQFSLVILVRGSLLFTTLKNALLETNFTRGRKTVLRMERITFHTWRKIVVYTWKKVAYFRKPYPPCYSKRWSPEVLCPDGKMLSGVT
jgi:hypothetical protein